MQTEKQNYIDKEFIFSNNKNVILMLFQFCVMSKIYSNDEIIKHFLNQKQFNKNELTIASDIIKKNKIIISKIKKIIYSWPFHRLGNIEKALLLFGIYYLHYKKEIKKNIIIFFCIKYAKRYCDKLSFRLINKILANYLQN